MFLVFLNPWVYCFLASSSLFDVENLNICVQQQWRIQGKLGANDQGAHEVAPPLAFNSISHVVSL